MTSTEPVDAGKTRSSSSKVWSRKGKGINKPSGPAFEIVVLGSGGGPLETDCSGYIVKALSSRWEDGILALEGGSGLGALSSLLTTQAAASMFPTLTFPPDYNTPVLQAAYVFSFLTCYLITHAHLDHVQSLIMLTGSFPRRAPPARQSSDSLTPAIPVTPSPSPCPPVYGTRKTLEKLAVAYGGDIWPELAVWSSDQAADEGATGRRKRRKVGAKQDPIKSPSPLPTLEVNKETPWCLTLSPLSLSKTHRQFHDTLPLSIVSYPVVHGSTSRETYESSAMFIRYDPSLLGPSTAASSVDGDGFVEDQPNGAGKEFLFFGDLEGSFRQLGDEKIDADRAKESKVLNKTIWQEAAKSWKDGRLCGIFIECSYDSARPSRDMYGHLSPPALYHEMRILARLVSTKEESPLRGLRVYITHIKERLSPHPTGKTPRELIMSELRALEEQGGLGIEFIETKRGDRIVL
ncbi:hypothetical protein IAT38_002264 [Cryptococcus sp. DSM 104549]